MQNTAERYKTWVELSARNASDNIKNLRRTLHEGCAFAAVLKANAYGHGLKEYLDLLNSEHISHFAVDSLEEGIAVRKRYPNAVIFILGFSPFSIYESIIQHDLIQTLYTETQLSAFIQTAREKGKRGLINVKVETGTNRQGVDIKDLPRLYALIQQNNDAVELVGLSTHFSDAEDPKYTHTTNQQIQLFRQAEALAIQAELRPHYVHSHCSAAAILNSESQGNMSRFGISLYGLWASKEVKFSRSSHELGVNLTPVLSWHTAIAQTKQVKSGDRIGYGHGYIATRPMRIAVLPIGYYDGLDRTKDKGGDVLILGRRCKIIGNICMNMTMVDISHLPESPVTDAKATIIGRSGMHEITADEIAERRGTIPYEVTTGIGSHIQRIIT